jgi:hypothetical protein
MRAGEGAGVKAVNLQLTCPACALEVLVEFLVAASDDPVSAPEWTCPSCRASHPVGVMGRVRSAVSIYSPWSRPSDDGR